ncbi:hypothetical protein P3S67_010771 [Capsicum chacoense]
MESIKESAECHSLRLFLWNEKLTRNQVIQSEGLCVFIMGSKFMTIDSNCGYTIEEKKRSTVIPFDLLKLRNREASLGSLLVSSTLQFLPETIKELGDDISYRLFTEFQDSQALLPPPRPTYVIVVEISGIRINFTDDVSPDLTWYPPDIPLYRRFEKEEEVSNIHNVNDSCVKYSEDTLNYLDILREYTGEGGICPTEQPIAVDVAKGFVEFERCKRSWCPIPGNRLNDLTHETCPICYDKFKDENEVITTYCSHMFDIRCLLPWLSRNNTCPTCRAVYPLHYSPSLDRQFRMRKHNMMEDNV